jgi:hypothetical protein
MATIGVALRSVKQQLDQWVNTQQIEQICRDLGHRWRERVLGPATTVHLFLLQLLAGVALNKLRHLCKLSVTGEAIRVAKRRLPLKLLSELVDRVRGPHESLSQWNGLQVFIADALSFWTEDTPQLSRKYGKGKNQRGTSNGRPLPKLLATLDLNGGLIQKALTLPWSRNERTCLHRMLKVLPPLSILLGDRGLVGFAQVALMAAAGVQACLHLPRWLVVHGRGKGNHRRHKRLGRQDVLVRWRRDRRCAWMSKKRWNQLPQELLLRQVAFRILRPGYRPQWAWIVTTLTDHRKYPAGQLVELYAKRWQVEVYFRDLKCTLKMGRPRARDVAGVRKEVLTFVLLYNLVRQVMLRAAERQQVEPQRLSFSDVTTWLLWSAPGEALPDFTVNAKRARPTQPRAVKQARKRWPPLRQSRASLCKPRCHAKL